MNHSFFKPVTYRNWVRLKNDEGGTLVGRFLHYALAVVLHIVGKTGPGNQMSW